MGDDTVDLCWDPFLLPRLSFLNVPSDVRRKDLVYIEGEGEETNLLERLESLKAGSILILCEEITESSFFYFAVSLTESSLLEWSDANSSRECTLADAVKRYTFISPAPPSTVQFTIDPLPKSFIVSVTENYITPSHLELFLTKKNGTLLKVELLGRNGFFEIVHLETQYNIKWKERFCRVSLSWENYPIVKLIFRGDNGVQEEELDVVFTEEKTVVNIVHNEEVDILQKERERIIFSHLENFQGANNDEKDKALAKITSMLTRDQTSTKVRELGLEILRTLYKEGEVNIINRLWKLCKNTFDIQPYNIIDINSLSIEEEIGKGTFGCVKRAVWLDPNTNTQREVAVKFIQENTQMFDLSDLRGEFVALSILDHPNIMTMHGGGFIKEDLSFQSETYWFIVMDCMKGNLCELIHNTKSHHLGTSEKLQIALQIALGLRHLHVHKIIHRDIKPENILYDEDMNMKIADLGISKPSTDTFLRTAIGTHGYMAPELSKSNGRAEFSFEVDIFSLGILLFELFTSKSANDFSGSLTSSRFRKIEKLKLPSSLHPRISKLITQCTSSLPHKRPTAEEICLTLSEVIGSFLILSDWSPSRRSLDHDLKYSDIDRQSKGEWWEHLQSGHKSKFPESTNALLEETLIRYLGNPIPENEFCKFTSKKGEKYRASMRTLYLYRGGEKYTYIRRVRVSGEPTKELSITVKSASHCGIQDLNIIELKSSGGGDCSDVVEEVTFSTRDAGIPTKKLNNSVLLFNTISSRVLLHPPYRYHILHDAEEWVHCSIQLLGSQSKIDLLVSLQGDSEVTFPIDAVSLPYIENMCLPWNPLTMNEEFWKSLESKVSESCLARANNIIEYLTKTDITLSTSHNLRNGKEGIAYALWRASMSDLFSDEQKSQYLTQSLALFGGKEILDIPEVYHHEFYEGKTSLVAMGAVLYEKEDPTLSKLFIEALLVKSRELLTSDDIEKPILKIGGFLVALSFLLDHGTTEIPELYSITEELYSLFVKKSLSCQKELHEYYSVSSLIMVLLSYPEQARKETFKGFIYQLISDLITIYIIWINQKGIPPPDIPVPVVKKMKAKAKNPSSSPQSKESQSVELKVIPILLKAYRVYGDESFLSLVKPGMEIAWEKGLTKTFHLLNGITGTTYLFLMMYQETKEREYLYKALSFMERRDDPRVLVYVGTNYKCYYPLSLMEGIAGELCLNMDMTNPEDTCFPLNPYYNIIR